MRHIGTVLLMLIAPLYVLDYLPTRVYNLPKCEKQAERLIKGLDKEKMSCCLKKEHFDYVPTCSPLMLFCCCQMLPIDKEKKSERVNEDAF